jgi:hypothetical protein
MPPDADRAADAGRAFRAAGPGAPRLEELRASLLAKHPQLKVAALVPRWRPAAVWALGYALRRGGR